MDEFTLSFVSSTHPRAMLGRMKRRGLEVRAGQPGPGIYTVAGSELRMQVVVLGELEDPQTSYMFAVFLTRPAKKSRADFLLLKKHLEDPADKDLEQLVDFMVKNELVETRAIEEVWNMAQQMPVTNREKLAELFDRHPFGQELRKRFMEQGLQQG
ncbi:MAG: hypothetical protein D9V47_14915 [Clostridia bacterium]|nr:MAG: hypothetical protein D9V47_14915 [Clostridia bacterium]